MRLCGRQGHGGHITLRICDIDPANLLPQVQFKCSARSLRSLQTQDGRVARPFLRCLRYTQVPPTHLRAAIERPSTCMRVPRPADLAVESLVGCCGT